MKKDLLIMTSDTVEGSQVKQHSDSSSNEIFYLYFLRQASLCFGWLDYWEENSEGPIQLRHSRKGDLSTRRQEICRSKETRIKSQDHNREFVEVIGCRGPQFKMRKC